MKSDYRYLEFMVSCCVALQVDVEDVLSRVRFPRAVVEARHLVAFGLRERFNLSYPHTGHILGARDHTTVMHSIGVVRAAELAGKRWATDGLLRVRAVAPLLPVVELESPLESLGHG